MSLNITVVPETKKGTDQIRIRVQQRMCQAVVIVADPDGWEYDQYDGKPGSTTKPNWAHKDSTGLNVRISMNGPLRLTAEEWYEFSRAVDEALERTPGVF